MPKSIPKVPKVVSLHRLTSNASNASRTRNIHPKRTTVEYSFDVYIYVQCLLFFAYKYKFHCQHRHGLKCPLLSFMYGPFQFLRGSVNHVKIVKLINSLQSKSVSKVLGKLYLRKLIISYYFHIKSP